MLFRSAYLVDSGTFTGGHASLTKDSYIATLTDGTATLEAGSLTSLLLAQGTIGSFTHYRGVGGTLTGLLKYSTLTDETTTLHGGSITGGNWVDAEVGSFTTLYGGNMFVASDLVVNGTTTYVNTSQTAFEDELLSLGASDGRNVTNVTGDGSGGTLTADSAWPTTYTSNSYVVLMTAAGSKGITKVNVDASGSSTNLTTTTVGGLTISDIKFAAIIPTEATASGSGIEILASSTTTDKSKSISYDQGSQSMSVVSQNAALDLRISNADATSYYGILDGGSHKKLMTSDALFLNTQDGTITGGSDVTAIYLSKNAGESDANKDWRMRIASNAFVVQMFNGSTWQTKFSIDA